MTPTELTAIIEQALLTVLDVEEFELTESFDGKGIDVSGDDWTWHVDDEISYLAVDDEPDVETAYPAAIERNLTTAVITAIQQIDEPARIVLANRLANSGDPISLAFAGMLRTE